MNKLLLVIFACLCVVKADRIEAVELLSNGDLEVVSGGGDPGPPPGWSLAEFPTSGSGSFNTAQQIDFADVDGGMDELGLWIKPFAAGDQSPGQLVNAVLSQSVPAAAGEGYSFSGWSRWELNYAGGVATLDPSSPFGAIPSPTRTEMELAFLNSGGSVIQSHLLDLRTVQNNFDIWRKHDFNELFGGDLPLVAPTGTASARVTAAMIDGAWNVDPQQSGFFDDFSLIAASAPAVELLANANLDVGPPPPPPDSFEFWTQTENPAGTDTIGARDFAQNPNTAGSNGAWLKPWAGFDGLAGAVDAILSQTVPGTEGGEYTFTGWSVFETNYSGGVDNLSLSAPTDPGAPSPTETTMELAFLDGSGTEIGTPITLDLRLDRESQTGGSANDGGWLEHTIQGTAPTGTALVRVTAAMLDGVFNTDEGGPQSAFFDDFSLDGPAAVVDCDFNGDGNCNGVDIDALVAQIAAGTNNTDFDLTGDNLVNLADRDEWLAQAGAMNLVSENPYLLGDANLDGTVDGADFLAWNNNKFTDLAAWTKGDFTAEGTIDGADFLVWNNFKFMTADGVATVPEASASLLVILGLLGWATRRGC